MRLWPCALAALLLAPAGATAAERAWRSFVGARDGVLTPSSARGWTC